MQTDFDRLRSSVNEWNKWREENPALIPDLGKADLQGIDLTGVNLSHAILTDASLAGTNLNGANLKDTQLFRVNFEGANLTDVDLSRAILTGSVLQNATLIQANFINADLSGVDCSQADFSEAKLTMAKLVRTTLSQANFSKTILQETLFSDVDLSEVQNLDGCFHGGPSNIDARTLTKSGRLPDAFLRGLGLSDWEIENAKLYQGHLSAQEITDITYKIFDLRSSSPVQFNSCFISYSNVDEVFARKLFQHLQKEGVRCWFAPEDLKIGDHYRTAIDESIQIHDKLLIVLSEHSIKSDWVKAEVKKASEKENKTKRPVLFPIRIDDTVMGDVGGWPELIRHHRHIGDFTKWKSTEHFGDAFTKLLSDLKS